MKFEIWNIEQNIQLTYIENWDIFMKYRNCDCDNLAVQAEIEHLSVVTRWFEFQLPNWYDVLKLVVIKLPMMEYQKTSEINTTSPINVVLDWNTDVRPLHMAQLKFEWRPLLQPIAHRKWKRSSRNAITSGRQTNRLLKYIIYPFNTINFRLHPKKKLKDIMLYMTLYIYK